MTDNIHGRDNVIMNLKKIDLSNIHSDADIYKLYNISEDEQKIIDITIGKANIIHNALSNDLQIIQKGRSKYYLVDNKLYKINKNNSQGEFYCDYVDNENEVKPKRVIKKKTLIASVSDKHTEKLIKNSENKHQQIAIDEIEEIKEKPKRIIRKKKNAENNNA